MRPLPAALLTTTLLAAAALPGCANVGTVLGAVLENRIAISPMQLQGQLDRRFPRDYRKGGGLVDLRVMHPRLSIVPGTTRLRIDFDVGVGALGHVPDNPSGHFAVSSGIRFDMQRMGLMLDTPSVDTVDVPALGGLGSQLRPALTQWVQDYSRDEAVYTLDSGFRERLGNRHVDSAVIEGGKVVVNLAPGAQ